MTFGQKAAKKLVTLKPVGEELATIVIAGIELGYEWKTNGETVAHIRAAIAKVIDAARTDAREKLLWSQKLKQMGESQAVYQAKRRRGKRLAKEVSNA